MVSENIRTLRKAFRLSQSEFAERVGVSRSVVNNLELGLIQNLEAKMPLLRLISKEFGVDLDWLLNGEGEPELADLTEAEKTAQQMGQFLATKDPVVKAFLAFWAAQSDKERERIAEKILDFADFLRRENE